MEGDHAVLYKIVSVSGRGRMTSENRIEFVVGHQAVQQLSNQSIKGNLCQGGYAIAGGIYFARGRVPNVYFPELVALLQVCLVSFLALRRPSMFGVNSFLDPGN